MILGVSAWTIGFFLAFLFACKGDFAAWWGSIVDFMTTCVDTMMLLYAFAISDVVTDIVVLLLPLPMVCSLWLSHITSKINIFFLKGFLDLAPASTDWSKNRNQLCLPLRIGVSVMPH